MRKRKTWQRFAGVLLVGAGLMIGAEIAGAETAAGIRYDIVTRPPWLRADLPQGEGATLTFLAIKTIDGFQVDSALWQPSGKSPADTTIVVMVHGSGGNYSRPPESALGPRLAAKGYGVLAINTRQHDEHLNTDNFFDVRRDIEAAVYTARALGYRRIVLQGHSLGNIQVQYYAATNWDRDIKAVMLLGAFGNLPWKTRNILVQNEKNFKHLIDASMQSLREGTLDQVLPPRMHYFTGQDVPVTGQHFLTYRWDRTSVADGTFWISRIPQPIFLVRDRADALILPFEPYMLLSAAHAEGSLVTSIDYTLLPDDAPPGLKGHYFEGNEQRLADVLVKWLSEHRL